MKITKEQADKVIAALVTGRVWASVGRSERAVDFCDDAITIMRGLEDAAPVCNHEWFQTGAMLSNEKRCIKCGEWGKLYTSPQAAQTEGWTGDTEIDAALIMLDRMEVGPHDDDRLDEIAKLLRKLAGRAGRKG